MTISSPREPLSGAAGGSGPWQPPRLAPHRFSTLALTLLAGAIIGVAPGASPAEAAPNWKKLHAGHTKSTRKQVVRLLRQDGVRDARKLLSHRYLVRLEIRGAGGGTAKHSEVVVRFRSTPASVLAKAWSPGGRQRTAAQLGVWSACKTKRNAVGRTCPVKYNGRGFVDVTSAFTARNVLFVHDPRRKGAGNTIVWFAADRSQRYLWYYVVPKSSWPSFGTPRVRVRKFLVPKAMDPPRLPGAPPDPGNGISRPRPRPRPLPRHPSLPRLTPRPAPGATWTVSNKLHRALTKAQIAALMRQDGVPNPAYMLHSRFLLRVSLTSAGGGSSSRTELLLRLISRPKRALGKAWSDRPDLRRAQIGGSSRCAPLPRGRGGPEGHRCRVHFNNLGWRNLISAFTEKSVRIISDPNNPKQGNVLLWLAFDQSQSGLAHRFVQRSALPTFGKGDLSLRFFAIVDGAGISPRPRLTNPPSPSPSPGWRSLGSSTHLPIGKAALAARMRRDGVRATAYMLQHKYLVRLSISGAGGGRGYRSELIFKMSSRPAAALGTAWNDHRGRWGAQIGARSLCRPLARALNPYSSYGALRWHSCPIRYNGLGWRNLISAFSSTEMMLVTVSRRRAGGNQLLWLAFDKPQALLYKLAGSDRAHRIAAGTLKAEKFVHGQGGGSLSPAPRPGGLTAWRANRGAHRSLHRNQLYWKIRKDGFSNPWFLLKKRYLVRLQIASASGLSHTVLRLANPPGVAVGTGLASGASRSGVQAGSLARCMSAGSRPRCPLHYANLGWRNLSAGLAAKELLFVTAPSRGGRGASTIVWMAFDNPQSLIRLRNLRTDRSKATVTIGRYRW